MLRVRPMFPIHAMLRKRLIHVMLCEGHLGPKINDNPTNASLAY